MSKNNVAFSALFCLLKLSLSFLKLGVVGSYRHDPSLFSQHQLHQQQQQEHHPVVVVAEAQQSKTTYTATVTTKLRRKNHEQQQRQLQQQQYLTKVSKVPNFPIPLFDVFESKTGPLDQVGSGNGGSSGRIDSSSSSSSSSSNSSDDERLHQPEGNVIDIDDSDIVFDGKNEPFIPEIFYDIDRITYIQVINRQPYPRWDTVANVTSNLEASSTFDGMMDYITAMSHSYAMYHTAATGGADGTDLSSMKNNSTEQEKALNDLHWNYIHTDDHNNVMGSTTPELVYVMDGRDGGNVYVSRVGVRVLEAKCPEPFQEKRWQTEPLLRRALRRLIDSTTTGTGAGETTSSLSSSSSSLMIERSRTRWPRLYDILVVQQLSVPFIMWNGDYTGCNHLNWYSRTSKKLVSVPLFTVAGTVSCQKTIPFPNYQTIVDAEIVQGPEQQQNQQQYGKWTNKIPQVVWRGTLTGIVPQNDTDIRGDRYRLLQLVNAETTSLTPFERGMFDVKALHYSHSKKELRTNPMLKPSILGAAGSQNWIKLDDSQKYKAILDIDGYSWSSRFGRLLCSSSVVLKVEPMYVDYFQSTVLPWVHYIPIQNDLSDLVEKARYVVSENDDTIMGATAYATNTKFNMTREQHIQMIITNANNWCQQHMNHDRLTNDALDIFETYVTTILGDESSKDGSASNTSSSSNIRNRNSEAASSDIDDDDDWQNKWTHQYYPTIMDSINGPLRMVPIE
jgi:Glycosyl transferase family 90